MNKKLVVYFSATGTTKEKAMELALAEKADLCEIVPEIPYAPADLDWMDKKSRSTLEMVNSDSRPAMAEKIDTAGYDEIFVGFPIWWGLAPRIVETFLESENFAGKKIIPFATSGGSTMKKVHQQFAPLCQGAILEEGKLLNGVLSEEEIRTWADAC